MLSQSLSKRENYKWWVLFALAFGTFAFVMTHGSVNVALPTIATYFGTDLPTVQWVVIAEALPISALLLPMGNGLFNSANSASIFSAAEANKHGVVSALLSLARNSSNVTSMAVATTIVTATMVPKGYAPALGDVRESEDTGVLNAFVSGLQLSHLMMGSVLFIGISASIFKGPQQANNPTEPAPEPQARAAAD